MHDGLSSSEKSLIFQKKGLHVSEIGAILTRLSMNDHYWEKKETTNKKKNPNSLLATPGLAKISVHLMSSELS